MRATSLAVVTLNTSSTVVIPRATRRQPSSASVRIPARRAVSRIWSVDALSQDHLADVFVGVHPFKNPVATEKAGVTAFAAANRAIIVTLAGIPRLALKACAVSERSSCLQWVHRTRTRRCASTASSDEATRYGSTPMSTRRVNAPGASLVCKRRKHEVAGQRRLHGDLGRLLVADFADENDVGIVTQNRTQAAGKGQARFFRNLDLVDALELIFDGVFDGDDFAQGIIDFIQRGVQRRGFAATGRARDQDDSVRQLEDSVESSVVHVLPCPIRPFRAGSRFGGATA